LNWVTVSEYDLAYYEVQRSADALDFYPIGSVNAVGSLNELTYTFNDMAPLNNVGFYRLRIVDIDGSEEYSPIIAIRRSSMTQGVIYPNPAADQIQLDADIAGATSIIVVDAAGREISRRVLGQDHSGQFNISSIPAGWYILQVLDQQEDVIYRGSFTKR